MVAMGTYSSVLALLSILAAVAIGLSWPRSEPVKQQVTVTPTPTTLPSPTSTPRPSRKATHVPFTAQAPLGQWGDPVFQDGCEEASLLMAWHWVQGTGIKNASAEIQQLSGFQLEQYGEFRDRSAADTAQLIRDYFGYDQVSVETDVSVEDIKAILRQGSIAVLPMNGQALSNPHFTPPGPERHMLVVHGYDAATNEFITNDPGTKHGQNYRYPADVFYNAIRDYPTGYHKPIQSVEKVMIVIAQ